MTVLSVFDIFIFFGLLTKGKLTDKIDNRSFIQLSKAAHVRK